MDNIFYRYVYDDLETFVERIKFEEGLIDWRLSTTYKDLGLTVDGFKELVDSYLERYKSFLRNDLMEGETLDVWDETIQNIYLDTYNGPLNEDGTMFKSFDYQYKDYLKAFDLFMQYAQEHAPVPSITLLEQEFLGLFRLIENDLIIYPYEVVFDMKNHDFEAGEDYLLKYFVEYNHLDDLDDEHEPNNVESSALAHYKSKDIFNLKHYDSENLSSFDNFIQHFTENVICEELANFTNRANINVYFYLCAKLRYL